MTDPEPHPERTTHGVGPHPEPWPDGPEYDRELRQAYGSLPNLELLGFIDQFRSDGLTQLLSKSWILANTAAREGLPNSFIEAAAHGCAILSAVDPDGFASRFGRQVTDDNFAAGLRYLLENDRWRGLAAAGYQYVRDTFSLENAIDRHLAVYEHLTGKPRPAVDREQSAGRAELTVDGRPQTAKR